MEEKALVKKGRLTPTKSMSVNLSFYYMPLLTILMTVAKKL